MLGRATATALLAVAALVLLTGDGGVGDRPGAALAGIAMQGDVNCSRSVDSIDALQILRNSAALPISADCLEEAADVNCDGGTDSIDSLRILRFAAALPNTPVGGCVPIGEPLAVPTFLLNELGLWPPGAENPFAELINTGDAAASAGGLRLVTESGGSLTVPEGSTTIPAGGVTTVDLSLLTIDRQSGFFELHAGTTELDHVGWGPEQPDAVRLSRGGIADDPAPGSTIGRVPGSDRRDRSEWLPYSPSQATPGELNQQPGVEFLMPLHGAIFDAAEIPLTWYSVPHADGYRVQVATDDGFTAPVVDQSVEEAQLVTPSLAEGTYFWRVQAIFENAGAAPFSAPHQLTVDHEARVGGAGTQNVELDVPFIPQHKDTKLLLLDGPTEIGPHAWDVSHPGYHPNDPADNTNCALASIVMVNRFLGGNLTQDRLGIEINTRGQEDVLATPEFGPYFNRGTNAAEVEIALQFAIGSGQFMPRKGVNADWSLVMDAIDSGIPLVAAYTHPGDEDAPIGHAVTIFGYGTDGQQRYIAVNDPSVGQYALDFDLNEYRGFWGPNPEVPVNARSDEPSIHADSDADGMMDFDEAKRFKTSEINPDTDADLVHDKEEVRETVFDPQYGYVDGVGLRARYDWDDDGRHKERDCDADNDGHPDGVDTDDFSTPPVRGSPVPCNLGERWVGEVHTNSTESFGDGLSWHRTIAATNLVFTAVASPFGSEFFDTVGGTVTTTVSGDWNAECTAEGSVTLPVEPGDGFLHLFTTGDQNYFGEGYTPGYIPVTIHCPSGDTTHMQSVVSWMGTATQPLTNPNRLEGMIIKGGGPNYTSTQTWLFTREQ